MEVELYVIYSVSFIVIPLILFNMIYSIDFRKQINLNSFFQIKSQNFGMLQVSAYFFITLIFLVIIMKLPRYLNHAIAIMTLLFIARRGIDK
jgi:hypothetical protein